VDETITTQFLGSKRISLFRLTAENWRDFAPVILGNWHHLSHAGHFFPKEATLSKYEGVLEAGDAVYLPPFWWHGIDPADTGLGVTLAHCFRSPVRRFGAWEELVTRHLIHIAASTRMQLLPLLARISFSSMVRKLHQEKWWRM
jgi:hypothetical protein